MIPEARVAQPVTELEATRLAREIFGLEVSAKSLPGEYDDNFHLTSTEGPEFVLKVMHPEREQSFVDMQCQALQHLATFAPQLSLPRVCATPGGDVFTFATLSDGTKRILCEVLGIFLLKWTPPSKIFRIQPRIEN
jgi:Ser/Thr protein kinase RdoA (MazF antagonist)